MIGEPGPHQHWVAGDQDAIAWHSGLRQTYNKSSLDFNNTYSVAWAVLSYAPTDKEIYSYLTPIPLAAHQMELPIHTGDDGIR